MSFGLKPTSYKAKFQILADYIHTLTNLTAMVWAPNIAGGTYSSPPTTFKNNYPEPGTDDFRLLDPNSNGEIENSEDSYQPYYPGDEYVDW